MSGQFSATGWPLAHGSSQDTHQAHSTATPLPFHICAVTWACLWQLPVCDMFHVVNLKISWSSCSVQCCECMVCFWHDVCTQILDQEFTMSRPTFAYRVCWGLHVRRRPLCAACAHISTWLTLRCMLSRSTQRATSKGPSTMHVPSSPGLCSLCL